MPRRRRRQRRLELKRSMLYVDSSCWDSAELTLGIVRQGSGCGLGWMKRASVAGGGWWVLCPSGAAHGLCPRRRADHTPSVPGAAAVKNIPVLSSRRRDRGPTILRLGDSRNATLRSSSSTRRLTLTREEGCPLIVPCSEEAR